MKEYSVIILPGILTSDENTDEVAEFATARVALMSHECRLSGRAHEWPQATSARALTAGTSATSVSRVRVANISPESGIRVTGQNTR